MSVRCWQGCKAQNCMYKALFSYMYRNFENPSSLLLLNSGGAWTNSNVFSFLCSAEFVMQARYAGPHVYGEDSERIKRERCTYFILFYFILFYSEVIPPHSLYIYLPNLYKEHAKKKPLFPKRLFNSLISFYFIFYSFFGGGDLLFGNYIYIYMF